MIPRYNRPKIEHIWSSNYKFKIWTEIECLIAEQVANYYIQNYRMSITGIRYPIIIGPGLNYRGVAAGISDMALATMQRNTKTLIEMGYKKVCHIEGGFTALKNSKFKIKK